jgi:hypothetical protein
MHFSGALVLEQDSEPQFCLFVRHITESIVADCGQPEQIQRGDPFAVLCHSDVALDELTCVDDMSAIMI